MKTFNWILPSHFMSKDETSYEFDLSNNLRTLIKNKFWERKINYEKYFYFNADSFEKIKTVKLKVFPWNTIPFSVTQEYEEFIQEFFGEVPEQYNYIYDRGNLRNAQSLSFIEITFDTNIAIEKNVLKGEEFLSEKRYAFDLDFTLLISELISISNELISLFLISLHITYPTHATSFEFAQPQSGGLIIVLDKKLKYYKDQHSNILTHPILIESNKILHFNEVLELITSVWHKNLWTIHRVLKALRSNFLEIDNLVDLIFSLESLFKERTSVETIRVTCSLIAGKNLSDAREIDTLLKTVFKIRNDIVHGAHHYRIMDKYKYNNSEILILNLFWNLKSLVIEMLVFSILKLKKEKQQYQDSLRINVHDIYKEFFQNKEVINKVMKFVETNSKSSNVNMKP